MEESSNGSGGEVAEQVTVAIHNLEHQLLRLRHGEITNDEFRPSRTILGVYGQRQPEQYMVRVRIPNGILSHRQLSRIAELARDCDNGVAHVTTRQNIQLHWLKLDKVSEVLQKLAEVGLATLQAGGNSVRTIASCPLAGVCKEEVFDVTQYASALDNHYLGNERVMNLPRKFKAAFSGCSVDCAYSCIQDFGAIAEVRMENGVAQKGFRISVGGGLGVSPRLAQPIEGFVPQSEVFPTCEAVLRLFDRLGNRKDKQKARLKFLIQKLGFEEVRRAIWEEREALNSGKLDVPSIGDGTRPTSLQPAPFDPSPRASADRDYDRWVRWNVRGQRQEGFFAVLVPLNLGDISYEQMETVAHLVELYAQDGLRTSQHQDMVLRGVPGSALPGVYDALRSVGLTTIRASGIADVTSCPGTVACSLGITGSKELAKQLVQILQEDRYQEDEALGGLRVKVSGCPDACGQHYLGDIGLYGCAIHAWGRLYPAYQILLGGSVTKRGTVLARPVLRVPARKVPQAIVYILDFYQSNRKPDEEFTSFVNRVGLESFRELLSDLAEVPSPREDIWNFIDWNSTHMYILQRGEGECAI